jgi:hypothetical protein
MSELPPTEALPAPPPAGRRPPARWQRALLGVVATAVGLGGAALVSDSRFDDGPESVAPTATARPVPVLAPGTGAALAGSVAEYALSAWSSGTRGFVLSAWGAAFSDLLGPGGEGVPPDDPDAALQDDPRLREPGGEPGFVDPCAGGEPGAEVPASCEDGAAAEVLDDGTLPANVAVVVAFPHPDVALAGECPFADLAAGEIPLAVITGNPGHVVVGIGAEQVEVDSTDDEVAEWEAWVAEPDGPRPPDSFVAHCIAVPRPPGAGPLHVRVAAEDERGQVALAETVLATIDDGLPPATVTPIDGTMVRIDVPVAEGADAPSIGTRRVAELGGLPPSCEGIGSSPAPSPWRIGTETTAQVAAPAGDRPYLAAAPAIHRATVPLPEGEPSIVCITRPGGTGPRTTSFLVTPPDARRLRLAVTELVLAAGQAADAIQVRGTFAELGWTPCGARLPAAAAEPGTTDPGPGGAMCGSEGDTGAIAGAGGALDLTVRVGPAVHRVRIGLSATPGGGAVESYRLPIPAGDLDGALCTAGADQPGCVPPEGDAVLGSLVVTATWDEGPVGPVAWEVAALAAA